MRDILILAYRYIPYTGVNGFRWTNISRELADLGHNVTVLTVSRKGKDDCDLTQGNKVDVKLTKETFEQKISEFPNNNIFVKIIKILFIKALHFLNIDDYATGWYNQISPVAQKYFEEHPNAIIIATGAPFSACFHAYRLSKRFGIKFIADFQDPWFNDPLAKESRRLNRFRKHQFNLIRKHASHCIYVTEGLSNHFSLTSKSGDKVIENGHNIKWIAKTRHLSYTSDKPMKWLYIGTLANQRDDALINWIECQQNSTVKEQLILDVYGRVSEKFKAYVKVLERSKSFISVRLLGFIEQHEIRKVAVNYHAGLQINAKCYPFLVSTKIYEYPALGLPTVSIHHGGDIEILLGHAIGVSINLNTDAISWSLDHIRSELSRIEQRSLQMFAHNNSWKFRAQEFDKLIELLS